MWKKGFSPDDDQTLNSLLALFIDHISEGRDKINTLLLDVMFACVLLDFSKYLEEIRFEKHRIYIPH